MTSTGNGLDLEYQAEMLAAKTKHYLITTMGRSSDEANSDEIYRALSYALREEIMIRWLATTRSMDKFNTRKLFYLSMEYLPGRIFINNLTNICAIDIVKAALVKLNRNLQDIMFCESDPGLGNGGLGRLASCFLDSLATHHYPAAAYGLRYQYGLFEQQLWDGLQIEAPDCWLINENPWEFRRDLRKVTIKYGGKTISSQNIHGDEIMTLENPEEVWAMPYDFPIVGYGPNNNFSVLTLRLWTTKDSPNNFRLQSYNAGRLDQATENTVLNDVLYPSDNHEIGQRIRLKQEFLLVSASLQDIVRHYLAHHENFRAFSDKVRIQINDTHPTLVIPELIRILTKDYDLPWKMAVDITRTCTGYTNHTILSEALEQWDQQLFSYLMPRQYRIIERLNYEFCNNIRQAFPADEEKIQRMSVLEHGKVRMANLAIVGSHSINGVAALHSNLLKTKVFKDFYDVYPDRFTNVTNGVTQRRWLLLCNPDLAKFITNRIGNDWITDFPKIRQLAKFADDHASLEDLIAIKHKNKQRLVDFLNARNRLRDSRGRYVSGAPLIDTYSLFDVQIKRIHEYKRQLLNALHLIMVYFEMLDNPHHTRIKRTAIFAGKAAASYVTAKDIIRLIYAIGRKVNRDPNINGMLKVLYVENYNVSKAEYIIPAADLSEQISTAGTEASGTGNMKLAINGALTIGTHDGANIEMHEEVGDEWWPFSFGATTEEIAKLRNSGQYDPRSIYEKDPKIKRAVDALRDHTFASNEQEHQDFSDLYHKLIEGHYGGAPDRYFTLFDLQSYYDTQLKVEALYQDQILWAKYSLHNIAGMGKFSTDVSIENYCKNIWQIEPFNIDQEILDRIQYEYREHDKCRIY